MAAKGMGAPEVGDVYTRAHTLCQQVGETPQRFRVLWGLCRVSYGPGAGCAPRRAGQQLFDLAQRQPDPGSRGGRAIWPWGRSRSFGGDLVAARAHLEQSWRLADPCRPPPALPVASSGGHPLTWMAQVLWGLGYADQARQRSQEALALARQAGHTPSLAYADALPPRSASAAETWRRRRRMPTP